MINMSRVATRFMKMEGGLDMVSAATLVKDGRVIDSRNYEVDSVNGGYGRIRGYERFDGHASPSEAAYWKISATISATVTVGATLTGAASSASGTVLLAGADFIILGAVTGTYQSGENLQISGVTKAVATSTAVQSGESDPANHATYVSLAADSARTAISAVPGSGAILGVWLYNDTVYAFRNNVGGTAAVLYKETASGWSAVTMFKEIAFSSGLVKPTEGSVLYGGTSTATGVVKRVVTRTGSWGSTAQGYFVIQVTSGTFQSGEALKLTNGAGATQATSASLATDIAFAPSGSFEFTNYNFTGSSSNWRMYGCDGVNPAFEFDGTVLCFIRTGMTDDKPSHVAAHKNYLFLSFKGSLQNSGIGDPYAWSLALGATEIGAGDDITALLPQPGDASTSAMTVFCKTSTKTIYGNSASDWKLMTASPTTGGIARSAQFIGAAYVLAERGIQQIGTTINFGDFQFASITGVVQPLINQLKGKATCSTVYKERNQYRIFFNDGSALAVTMAGANPVGIMYVKYPIVARCYTTANKADGKEYSYFGSDDGYVYRDNVGTSFDGAAIEAWLRMPFSHMGAPLYTKTFRRVVLDMTTDGYTGFQMTHELNGGDAANEFGVQSSYAATGGTGGYWDLSTWDSFNWDIPAVVSPSFDLYGTEKNISLCFYSNSAIYQPHSIQGANYSYTMRRLAR